VVHELVELFRQLQTKGIDIFEAVDICIPVFGAAKESFDERVEIALLLIRRIDDCVPIARNVGVVEGGCLIFYVSPDEPEFVIELELVHSRCRISLLDMSKNCLVGC
tara:strand:+ start:15797 stop:16117 length:321 start_codon:yes stop_codon:yes gene_type:complete